MRLFYCDPALATDVGHHAQSCRLLVSETRRRGIETLVFANDRVDIALQAEIGARPHFRVSTYSRSDGDPVCGWLSGFHVAANTTAGDLRTLAEAMRPEDVLYLNSGQAAQLMALVLWLTNSPSPRRTAIEFGIDPGLDVENTPAGVVLHIRDPRIDPNAVLYRYAIRHLRPELARWLKMATFDPDASLAYGQLLSQPVTVLPVPRARSLPTQVQPRVAQTTIAVLGHQRSDKGYQFVPEIFANLAARFPYLRLLAHNCAPTQMAAEQAALRELAAREPRVLIDERVADAYTWNELLTESDVILCPYDPSRFALSYSSVASEGVANGIPLVVPAGTTLARTVAEFGAGTAFPEWTAASITEAAVTAIEQLDAMRTQAAAGAERWAQQHGPAACLTALLRLLSEE